MRHLLGTLALALLLSACGGSTAEEEPEAVATTSAAPDPMAGAPEVDDCHDFALSSFPRSDSEPPVDCTERHTTRTMAVLTVPASARATQRAEREWAMQACLAELGDFLGGRRSQQSLTVFAPHVFFPDEEQAAAGATWARCDVYADGGHLQPPVPLPPTTPYLRRAKVSDDYALCYGDLHGAAPCAQQQRGQDRVVAALPLKRFTGDAVRARALDFCRRTLGDDVAFGYTWPTEEGWEKGERAAHCYVEDR